MFLEFLNFPAATGANTNNTTQVKSLMLNTISTSTIPTPTPTSLDHSEKLMVNLGVIGPLLSNIMDDEWNERSQVLGFKTIGCLSLDKDVRAYLGVC